MIKSYNYLNKCWKSILQNTSIPVKKSFVWCDELEIGIDICIKWITNKNLLYKKINKIKFKKKKRNLGIKGNFLKLITDVCTTPAANTMLNDETRWSYHIYIIL